MGESPLDVWWWLGVYVIALGLALVLAAAPYTGSAPGAETLFGVGLMLALFGGPLIATFGRYWR